MNPSPRSPSSVLADVLYRRVSVVQFGVSGGGIYVELVVVHCGTDTFWRTRYGSHADYLPADWVQVKRKIVTQEVWEQI